VIGRGPRQVLLVALFAVWQAVTLLVCVPAARANPTTAPTTAPACCDVATHVPTSDERPTPTNCPHCTNGIGHFADPVTPTPDVAPDVLVERVVILDLAARVAVAAVPGDAWLSFHPPDPTLLALRCALVR
jgi:hypothetical protein